MKNFLIITILLLFTVQESFAQKQFEIDGAIVPRTIDFQDKTLLLNGFGTRSKMWIDVYVQALFVLNLSPDAKYILNSDTEMAIRIQVTSKLVTSQKLVKALYNGIKKSSGAEVCLRFAPELKELEKYLVAEKINKDDAINMIYSTVDKNVWIYKNDKFQGKVKGFEFKKALFGIWLSENPVDKDLKKQLLGL